MKVTQATQQINQIRKKYLFKVFFYITLVFILITFLCLFYALPYYSNVFWSNFSLNKLSAIYSDNSSIELIITITVCLVLFLIGIIITLIILYKNNSKYQNNYLHAIYDELRLNEIYLSTKRVGEDIGAMENIYLSLGIKNAKRELLYSFKSFFNMDFYQLFSFFNRKKDYSLLIKCNCEKELNGYLQMRFDNKYTIDKFENEGIFQYIFSDTRKYSHDIIVNSSLKQKTYQIIDENVLQTMLQLKKFTHTNVVVTLTKKQFYVYIPGWELKLTDNLLKKLDYDSMDKKITVFTELIDEVTDIYLYLLNKGEIWEKKW